MAWVATVIVMSATTAAAGEPQNFGLVAAAKAGDSHAVHALVEADASLGATDAMGYTALHWAAIRAHWSIVAELLDAGAPVDVVGADGGTPLHWACHHDRPDIVGRMLDAGADIGRANRWGRTPLHVAARRGCADVVERLLSRGADPDAKTLEGWTPLHVAERSGHFGVAEQLRAAGANVDVRDAEGRRPADLHTPRPMPMSGVSRDLEAYVGHYDLGDGFDVKVWREGDVLRIREFAPDTLVPVARDEFSCLQEPWRVRFGRGGDGEVNEISIDFLRRTVRGSRTLSPRYVGSAVCITCHTGAAAGHADVKWLRSRHGHAYWRLAADWALVLGRSRPQYRNLEHPTDDERCLLCHVTGAQDPEALFAPTFRRGEGVGCEACHGPGSEYVDPAVMADPDQFAARGGRIPNAESCRGCHRRADGFDFDRMWPEIAHPRPTADEPPG